MPRPVRSPCFLLALMLLSLAAAASGAEEGMEVIDADLSAPAQVGLDVDQETFLREKAEAGDPALQCLYGLALLNGSAGRTDPDEALLWLKRSADAGDERGGFEYGKVLYAGLAGERDRTGSVKYLLPAAERGNMEAAYYVGAALVSADDAESRREEGLSWLVKAAEGGILNAQSDLGIVYYSGQAGVGQNYAEAARWFAMAARQGHGDSANKLGVMHQNGMGVEESAERAFLWFLMGAVAGDRFAQYNLGSSYMSGEWIAEDPVQAARWHEQAALRGLAESQYFMGCFYADGIGVEKDRGRAREWLNLAARAGNEDAAKLLDTLYEDGGDDAEDRVTASASELLREFAESGDPVILRDRVFLLRVDDGVAVSPAPEGGAYFLTAAGCPGIIYCEMKEELHAAIGPGVTLRAIGGVPSGLPGFIRLEQCEISRERSSLAPPLGEQAADAGDAPE